MKKLLSALTITLLLTVNTLADTVETLPVTDPPSADLIEIVTIWIVAIAIPNLLK